MAYWHVADIEAKLAEVTAAGATVKEPCVTSAAAAWWPPSPTPMATSWAPSGPMTGDPACALGVLDDTKHRITHASTFACETTDGTGSHRIVTASDAGSFTDLDRFA